MIDMPLLDTTYAKDLLGTFIADLKLQVMSFTAQFERDNIRQRQAEEIAAAKARGIKFGGKEKPLPDNFCELHRQWRNGEISAEELTELCGFSMRTLFNKLKVYRRQ